jgi:hypothetical protein
VGSHTTARSFGQILSEQMWQVGLILWWPAVGSDEWLQMNLLARLIPAPDQKYRG